MTEPRVGLWFIGAFGGVGSTTALGLAALARNLIPPTGLVTALPRFAQVPFAPPSAFVVGGHDIRQTTFHAAATELHERSNVFGEHLLAACMETLADWTANVRPGVVFRANATITNLGDAAAIRTAATPRAAIALVQDDLRAFQAKHALEHVVVVNVASTEPPFAVTEELQSLKRLQAALDRAEPPVLPTSSLYAYAAAEAGFPYVNITPSLGGSFPAFEELCLDRGVPHAGQDAKTGETLLKSVLAPMFAMRNLKVLSWVGHNILGNRDGQVLSDPQNKASKVKSKDALLADLLGYKPQSLVTIEYVESLDDWKTAWDHIHFEGFLGTKMSLQFTWQGCDSALAAPLVLDLARLTLRARRRGERGALTELAGFFKSPLGGGDHEMGKQFLRLGQYLDRS